MSLCRCRRVLILSCCLAALFLLAALASFAPHKALARASAGTITITSQSASVNFPDSMTFHVAARDSSSAIVSAQFVIDLQNSDGPVTNTVPLTGPPQRSVALTWQEKTTGNNFVTPGTTINYFWLFTDSAGTRYLQPQQQLTTTDTRFTWQHLNSGLLQVNWYNRDTTFGRGILSQASNSIGNISAKLGGGLQKPINLWVYETDSDFHGSLPPGSFEWVGGIAFPMLNEASIVVASTEAYTLSRDMPHELTHLIFHQLINQGNPVPTWFDEGLAVENQVFHEQDMTARFKQALASHSLLRLGVISSGFPADSDKAYLAYAQSWQLVQYMYDTFGQAKMNAFIKKLNDPSLDFSQAMLAALGVDISHLENQWHLSLHQPPTLTPDQITPTPRATPRPVVQTHGTGTASGDDRSWTLIILGGVLVIGSFAGLIALFVVVSRRKPAAQSIAGGATPNGKGAPDLYADPSSYMRNPVYAPPAELYRQPQQQPQPPGPPGAPGQEYSNYRPPQQYPQAPQE